MRLLTNLLSKVTLSSMVLTAPAMITLHTSGNGNGLPSVKMTEPGYYAARIIKRFVDHPYAEGIRAFGASLKAPAIAPGEPTFRPADADAASTRTAELKAVIDQASLLYMDLKLESKGLDEKAFVFAWRGYHNLLKKGLIRKKTVLSICDFSQSSASKRMYVIDIQHKRLLYRTYVAHGQKSGSEYATSFSNNPDSYMSSLGFYITQRTYFGHNGLSLRLNGVDSGYNDMAFKRMIVLHGSSYVSDSYINQKGTIGTSLGCPALPAAISGRIIRAVRGGSCLFIYHPTRQYLDNSPVINS
jgi:hypothetical protein